MRRRLSIVPNTVSFDLIAGQGGATRTAFFSNNGDSDLTFSNISYSTESQDGPWTAFDTIANGTVLVGDYTFTGIPTTISGNDQAILSIAYDPREQGANSVYIKAFSNGGNAALNVLGRASSQPKVLFEFEKVDGSGWTTYESGQPFSIGDVVEGTTRSLRFRVTNNASASAAGLSLTVSKPPFGLSGIVGAANNIDLAEGTSLAPGESETAALYCAVPKRQVNLPSYSGNATWTINTNTGDDSGKQVIEFVCNAVSEQVGPVFANGTAQYGYLGCFKEDNPGRQLSVQVYASAENNNGRCLTACHDRNYIFAGTQYHSECWCGNALPIQKSNENDCNFPCSGAGDQICGGDGYFHDHAQISLFADSTLFDGNTTTEPVGVPQTVDDYSYAGCYAENGAKTFNAKGTASDTMTVAVCQKFCGTSPYFGVQYGSECTFHHSSSLPFPC